MTSLTTERRQNLLQQLTDLGAGQAESESPHDRGRNFFPLAEHTRALEPEVVLVVGDRGAGKSQLFNALLEPPLLAAILRRFPTARLPSPDTGRTSWLPAHPLGAQGPDDMGWRAFAGRHEGDPAAVERLWFAYLVRVLAGRLDQQARTKLAPLIDAAGGDPEACFAALAGVATEALLALDRLDSELQRSDSWVFVAYDELDTVVRFDWQVMGKLIRGLVAFWTSHARRWARLRPKIFLRTDLFRRGTEMVGADISKLSANRAELVWNDRALYGMLVKRIVNRSAELHEYCGPALGGKLDVDPLLQQVPAFQSSDDARPFVERTVSKYMGANQNKGMTFTWVLDHLRDGNKRATPRSLVRLFERAAQREIDRSQASGRSLLHHTSIRHALDAVSRAHVLDAATHELSWLPGLKRRFEPDRLVPWRRRALEQLLSADFAGEWGDTPGVGPPAFSPRELVDYLLELGILRTRRHRDPRQSDRLDVPDLFLAGLGLRRKGGVRRE